MFYAAAAIAAQEYALRAAGSARRGAAVGAFVAVIYGGLFFGSVLGGLVASQFGFAAAFFSGAVLVAVALLLGRASMTGRAGDSTGGTAETKPRRATGWLSLRYLALVLGVAVPMNATMVIFIWYLTPLALADLESDPADIVRVLMLFTLAILFFGPRIAQMTDGRPGPVPLCLAGASISGLALLLPAQIGGYWSIVAAVAGVGIGQITTQTPLYAHALRITGGPGPGMDTLRLVERLGAIAALLASAALVGTIGETQTLRLLAGLMLAGIGLFAIVELVSRNE